MQMPVDTIISGGQTGVDRAALDTAIELDIPHTGWCPAGRLAEDGKLDEHYRLSETPTSDYLERTEWNVRDSDATLILNPGDNLEGGTAATCKYTRCYHKPCLVINLHQPPAINGFRKWINAHNISRLNIAGPRESKQPGIYQTARNYLLSLLGSD